MYRAHTHTHTHITPGAPGITLYTSGDGGASFTAACLPVALKVTKLCAHTV
jgi:hypothetical protein